MGAQHSNAPPSEVDVPKINVYLPDELAEAVRDTGVPVSAICQRALELAVRRITAIRGTVVGELDEDDLAERLPSFTDRARTAVSLGIAQARADGSPTVGTGHLMYGVLAEGQNLALRVLSSMEIQPHQVAQALAGATAAEPAAAAPGLRFSTPASAALELTVAEATGLGHNYVGCEHLLIGLAAEPDGSAGRALREVGADGRATRRAVTAALAGYAHLRAQGAATAPPAAMQALLTAVRQELAPVIRRIEQLEARVVD
jgi:ATP-dependent Clp protease ATP-binding subunit ClpC